MPSFSILRKSPRRVRKEQQVQQQDGVNEFDNLRNVNSAPISSEDDRDKSDFDDNNNNGNRNKERRRSRRDLKLLQDIRTRLIGKAPPWASTEEDPTTGTPHRGRTQSQPAQRGTGVVRSDLFSFLSIQFNCSFISYNTSFFCMEVLALSYPDRLSSPFFIYLPTYL